MRWSKGSIDFDSDYCLSHCSWRVAHATGITIPQRKASSIAVVSANAFRLLSKNKNHKLGSFTIRDLNYTLKAYKNSLSTIPPGITEDEYIKTHVPEDYHDFLDLFRKALSSKLPPHGRFDHKIPLKEGFIPPFGPIYSLSRTELEALRTWI